MMRITSIIAAVLMFGTAASAEPEQTNLGTMDVSKGSMLCLSALLAESYRSARAENDDRKLAWLSSGCHPVPRNFSNQPVVQTAPYGAVIQWTNGRWSYERHLIANI